MSVSKRDALATFCGYSGISTLLGLLPTRPGLLVLNYHRIGDADATQYDSGVFSATEEQFDEQVRFLKRHFHIVSLEEAIGIVLAAKQPRGTAVLLTFDDGYIDNYRAAFPILRAHGAAGAFFLPTSFIGTNRCSWWDSIAYIIKRCRRRKFRLGIPPFPEFDLDSAGPRKAVEGVLRFYKAGPGQHARSAPFIAMLEEACDSPRPGGAERCYLNWEEAAAMVRGGMAVGSHTQNHEILSGLPPENQLAELTGSRRTIEERLGIRVDALAYPVGLPDAFSSVTLAAAARAGYRAAFSFYGGFNRIGATDPYDIRRQLQLSPKTARFRMQTTLAAVTGRYWL